MISFQEMWRPRLEQVVMSYSATISACEDRRRRDGVMTSFQGETTLPVRARFTQLLCDDRRLREQEVAR